VQRFGEPPAECKFNAFLCTAERDELQALSDDYPKRWHVEEFFNVSVRQTAFLTGMV